MIPLLLVPWPTASTIAPVEAAMAPKKFTPAGVLTMSQLFPFQCSVNGPSSWWPTAQTSLAETAATAPSPLLPCGFGLGLGTTAQLVPLKCSITAVGWAE